MTLSKLSLRNATRQAQDYLVYFVTMIMAASLMYAFNCLVFSREILTLSSELAAMPLTVVLASIAVVCILGYLVHYITCFMLSKRSRELGTYLLIGLENRQIARMFFLENVAVGAVAFVLGLMLGNLVYQILRALMMAMFEVPYTFSLTFSPSAIALTLMYFAFVYLFAQLRSRRRLRSMKIHELIYYDRKNEEALIAKSSRRKRIFTLSIVLGLVGTVLLLAGDFVLGLLGAFCVIFFLYGFFLSFSAGVPAYFDIYPDKKFRNQTLLIFRTLSAKLNTMGMLMGTLSLLLTAVLLTYGTGLIFNAIFENRAAHTASFDLFIGSGRVEPNFEEYLTYIYDNVPVETERQYEIYLGENAQVMEYVMENQEYYRYYSKDVFMKYSDYAALRRMLGHPEAELRQGEYIIHCMPYLGNLLRKYGQPITVGGETLAPGEIYTEYFNQYLWDGNGQGYLLVIADEVAGELPVSHNIYVAMTKEQAGKEVYENLDRIRESRAGREEAVTDMVSLDGAEMSEEEQEDIYDTLYVKSKIKEESAASSALFVFPLYYLALMLTMTAATILTIQQLAETGRYRHQFGLLQKLGMDRQEMEGALKKLLAVYYILPALPPVMISIPFTLNLGKNVEPGIMVGHSHPLVIVGIALGLFLLIYLIYIMLTYMSLRRSVLPD